MIFTTDPISGHLNPPNVYWFIMPITVNAVNAGLLHLETSVADERKKQVPLAHAKFNPPAPVMFEFSIADTLTPSPDIAIRLSPRRVHIRGAFCPVMKDENAVPSDKKRETLHLSPGLVLSSAITSCIGRMDDGAVFPGKEERRRDAIARVLSHHCAAVKFFHLLLSLPGRVLLIVLIVTESTITVKGLASEK